MDVVGEGVLKALAEHMLEEGEDALARGRGRGERKHHVRRECPRRELGLVGVRPCVSAHASRARALASCVGVLSVTCGLEWLT